MTFGRRQCDPVSGCGEMYPTSLSACPSCGASDAFSDLIPFNPIDWVYDLECYPNIFTCALKHPNTGSRMFFEVSEWRNDMVPLIEFLHAMKLTGCRMVGFNSTGYDYPLLHFIIENYHMGLTYHDIYTKSKSIIDTPWERRFDNMVWDSDTHVTQVDLYKIHHFDNEARRTSLKMMEFNLRMISIQDLPYPPGTSLTHDQSRKLIPYNCHDVDATELLYIESIDQIEFREKLSEKYNRNFLNHNDTKIGKDYFVMTLNDHGVPCSKDRQTHRDHISLSDVIFPYIKLDPEFERVRQWFASQTLRLGRNEKQINLKGVFKDVSCTVDGFTFDFGAGGIHGSIDSTIVSSDDDFVLYDWDVVSFYPKLAIANRLYPEHLSGYFCDVYQQVFEQRQQYKKGTPENAMLKLALNGVYGDSNNKYSPFYDPQYTMSITINGQLLLCMLAQYLIKLPRLTMVQINTDGLTVRCPRDQIEAMHKVCEWWEQYTQLQLESAIYSRMFIRDVNNYIAEYESGDVKRKGAYEHTDLAWHKNHSALVIPKAAEASLLHGQCIRDFVINHPDVMDFMLRTKVGRADRLEFTEQLCERGTGVTQLQRITRYYVANRGGSMAKISPPAKGVTPGTWKRANSLTDQYYNEVIDELKAMYSGDALQNRTPTTLDVNGLPWDERINTKNRSMYDTRTTSINAGWLVKPCNDMATITRDNINFEFYIKEAEKLVEPLR